MMNYLRLARPHHWLKNLLVLLPLLCSGAFFEPDRLIHASLAFFSFSFLASGIYVINDIRDRERDRLNSTKCNRPIAAGVIQVPQAIVFCVILLVISAAIAFLANNGSTAAWVSLCAYFVVNLAYSLKLKNVPLIDIALLASGFLLRMLYGGFVTEIVPSSWLCLTVIAVSFYMGLGKRRGELIGHKEEVRPVLRWYNRGFLDKNMYMCIALAVMFYALWTVDATTVARVGSDRLVWTVPVVIMICMKYSLNIEQGNSDGDPVEVMLHDWILLLLCGLLAVLILLLVYTAI